jgi:hypothetical protein
MSEQTLDTRVSRFVGRAIQAKQTGLSGQLSLYECRTRYPIRGGNTECVGEEFTGGIRSYKPDVANAFDAAGCPLS